MQITFDEMPELQGQKIMQPTLYIWGKEDGLCQFFHPEIPKLEELREYQPGLTKQIALEQVGHWPQHEAAEVVSDEIILFMNQLKDNEGYH